jgi:hypothetical protein
MIVVILERNESEGERGEREGKERRDIRGEEKKSCKRGGKREGKRKTYKRRGRGKEGVLR